MRPSSRTQEDVRRLREHARNLRATSDHERRRYAVALAVASALRRPLERAGSTNLAPNPPSSGDRPSRAPRGHKFTVLDRTYLFERVYPLLLEAVEAHVPPAHRSEDAQALARALRYTCTLCSCTAPSAYHRSLCAHMPTQDVLAAQARLLWLYEGMKPLAI